MLCGELLYNLETTWTQKHYTPWNTPRSSNAWRATAPLPPRRIRRAPCARPTSLEEAQQRAEQDQRGGAAAGHPPRPDHRRGARCARPRSTWRRTAACSRPTELLDIKSTLIAARTLARTFERLADAVPHLCEIAARIPPAHGLVDAITRAISERGEILDSASDKLGTIRRELRIAHDRLMSQAAAHGQRPQDAPCTCRKR